MSNDVYGMSSLTQKGKGMGLFDFFKRKELLEWQNTLLAEPVPRLIMTEKQLKEGTKNRVENDLRIIKDCIKILGETTNPETYFSRLELMEKNAYDLVIIGKYANLKGATSHEAFVEFLENKQISIKEFLIRYFTNVFDKAEKLKTDNGKLKQYQKFYDSLQPYYSVMNSNNIDYIETKYRAYTRLVKTGRE